MTDLDRARDLYRMAGGRRGNGARPWLARLAGYERNTCRNWGEDGWPHAARVQMDAMEAVHPKHWPDEWRA